MPRPTTMFRPFPGRRLALAVLIAGAGPAVAVTPQAEEMAQRLATLVRSAPEVQQAQAEIAASQAEVRAAEVARYPRFGVDTVFGNVVTDLGNDRDRRTDVRLVPNVAYTVFDAGKASARIRAARKGVAASEAFGRKAAETVVLDTLTAYLQVLRFSLLAEVGSSSEAALRELMQLEERKAELGGAGLTDARLASSRMALSANRVLQYRLNLEEASARFAALFGLAPRLDQLPVVRVPGGWLSAGFDESVRIAMLLNPDLREASAKLEQAQDRLEAERAGRFPAVDLTVSKRYEFPGGFTEKPTYGFRMALGSGTFFESAAKVQRAEAEVGSQDQRRQALLRDVTQAVSAAWRRANLGGQRETLLQTAANESVAVFRARKRLNATGRATTLAMLDSQVEANNVLIDWVNAVFDQRLNELKLAKEVGKLLPPEGGEADWARALFTDEDFRSGVRELLRNAAPEPAVLSAERKPSTAAPARLGPWALGLSLRMDPVRH